MHTLLDLLVMLITGDFPLVPNGMVPMAEMLKRNRVGFLLGLILVFCLIGLFVGDFYVFNAGNQHESLKGM